MSDTELAEGLERLLWIGDPDPRRDNATNLSYVATLQEEHEHLSTALQRLVELLIPSGLWRDRGELSGALLEAPPSDVGRSEGGDRAGTRMSVKGTSLSERDSESLSPIPLSAHPADRALPRLRSFPLSPSPLLHDHPKTRTLYPEAQAACPKARSRSRPRPADGSSQPSAPVEAPP